MQNGGNGVTSAGTSVTTLSRCKIQNNNGYAISSTQKSIVQLKDTISDGNTKGDSISSDESCISKDGLLNAKILMSKLSKKNSPDEVTSSVLGTKSDIAVETPIIVQSKQSIKVKKERNGKLNSKEEIAHKRRPNTRKKLASVT